MDVEASDRLKSIILVGAIVATACAACCAIWFIVESVQNSSSKLSKLPVKPLESNVAPSQALDMAKMSLGRDLALEGEFSKNPNIAKFGKAQRDYYAGRYVAALSAFREVRAIWLRDGSDFPSDGKRQKYIRKTYSLAAQCLYEMHDVNGAESELSEAIVRYPGDDEFYNKRADLYRELGKTILAKKDMERARELVESSGKRPEASEPERTLIPE